jgi:peptide/nickel transport system substrate-binding protein
MLMRSLPKLYAAMTVVAAGAMALAACGGGSAGGGGGGTASGTPLKGGTLRLVAASGTAHLDTVSAYYTADYILEKVYSRQLVSYPYATPRKLGDAQWNKAITPVPDVATAMPTVTGGGTVYTFHIRSGVMWNTSPARQVTSQDFLREYKAFYNPVQPVGAPFYFNPTIAGLQTYDNQETAYFANAKKHPPTAANIAKFQNTHTISGITTPNSSTIVFHLLHPAADFIYMMAMPFASARPVEYDAYVPDSNSFRLHTISDGPYQLTSYVPGKSEVFSKNPAWKQSSDPIRHQYVNKITVTIGVPSAATQLADEKANTYDLSQDTSFEPTAIAGMLASKDPKFAIWPWVSTVPYVTFNLRSPDAKGAMGKLGVRQAIEYGISKVAVEKAAGGPAVQKIINTVIPPGNVGYQNYNLYPNNNGNGNTAKCKSTLAAAGYPHGVNLLTLYVNDSNGTRIFEAAAASLKPCGVNLVGKGEPGSSFFTDLGNAPVNNQPNKWDLTTSSGWIPDWFGNNGRTFIAPFFQTNCVVNTINYGCVSNSQMDSLIKKAESAPTTAAAGNFWHQADVLAMKNAWIVPLLDGQFPYFSSTRVHNVGSSAIAMQPNIGGPDLTNLWLNPNTP